MSNFWFNEDAFLSEPNPSGDADMPSAMFDDLSGSGSIAPNQSRLSQPQEQLNQQHQSPPQQSMQPPDQSVDSMFAGQDLQSFGGFPHQQQKQVPDDSQMFRQPDTPSQQFQQNQPKQQHPPTNAAQQQSLDGSEQEHLMKMRQQLLQQQMLQRQQQGSQPGRPQNGDQRHNMPQQGQGTPQMANGAQASPRNVSQPQPQNNFHNMAKPNTANYGGTPQSAQSYGSPAMAGMTGNKAPASGPGAGGSPPNQQNIPGKPSPAQIAHLQQELFLTTLNDFMSRRGTPIVQPPVINNKRINLFFLQILGRKVGGPQVVLKNLQMLSQPSNQMTEWSSICHKLGLFEGVDVQGNAAAKHQIEKQLGTCYLQYILPYEQYMSTEEGQKDIQGRRLHFQRQLLMRLQQKQQSQQQSPSGQQMQNPSQLDAQKKAQQQQFNNNGFPGQAVGTPVSAPSPMGQPMSNQQTPKVRQVSGFSDSGSISNQGQSAKVANFQSPHVPSQSPHGIAPTPGAINAPSPAASMSNSQRKPSNQSAANTPSATNSPYVQTAQGQRARSISAQRESSVGLSNEQGSPQVEPAGTGTPNTIKKYVPIKKERDSYGSLILKSISDLGDEIELTKPVYLFAPELGSLNIHALIMALKNYSPANPGEASSALNTLLVTTTDSNFAFNLADAPELLDALVDLGLKVLQQIVKQEKPTVDDYVDVKPDSKNLIDSIFAKHVANEEMKGEDVGFVVDSLTGEVVEDEESDIEIDTIFSPETVSQDHEMSIDDEDEITHCDLPDFMSALHKFRSENKHHFSEVQTKGAVNESVFLVDNLITITMTLRNLSFTERSSQCMSRNKNFKTFICRIIKYVSISPDSFVFQRKRFCLLKDCLLMLDRNANQLELDSLEEAFLIFLLVSSFGPSLDEAPDGSDNPFKIPNAPLEIYTYLPFSIDVFTKLIVREPKNKAFMQAVLTGTLSILNTSHLGIGLAPIHPSDQHETKKLMTAYFKNKNQEGFKSGTVLTKAFKLLMSSIPVTISGVEYTKFILRRSSTILQALFGAKLLIDLIPIEDVNSHLSSLTCAWLANNVQNLLFNFTKNTMSSITESVKFARGSAEHAILSFVGLRSLILVNSLLSNMVIMKQAMEQNEVENPGDMQEYLDRLKHLYRVQPEGEFVLNTLLASSIDADVAQEIVRFHGLMHKLA